MSRPALRHLPILALAFANALLSAAPELVTVGDPGNPGHETAFDNSRYSPQPGAVGHPYRIAKREVSNADYAAFLNAHATSKDPHQFFDERMKITRTGVPGAWRYAASPGSDNDGVAFVSRTNAARYCNFLTTGDPGRGPYKVEKRIRENGKTHDAIVGFRDLTFLDEARIYSLPDMHEFYKAGWYDGAGAYRKISTETRHAPSHYGLENHASGLREWIDNKYRNGATFALGASDSDTSAAAINATSSFLTPEYTANASTGFRVIATAPLQIGDRLNRHNNFFWQNEKTASLRIRLDDTPRSQKIRLVLRDFANRETWTRDIAPELRRGVTEIPIPLPENDGYYELTVCPDDPLYAGHGIRIPLAIMNTPMPAQGVDGNFGFTCHITRTERRFTFEDYDFDLLKRLGVSQVRVDVRYDDDTDGNQTVLRRIHDAGMNPLAIITRSGLRNQEDIRKLMTENPDLAKKWSRHGIPAEFAWHAEQVWKLVNAHKGIVRDWEFVNEPTYLDILAEDYAQVLKAGYIAAKLADPACNLMAGDLNAIHAPVFQTGGAAFADSIATHIYGFYVPYFWGIPGKMRELNGWMAAAGIAQKPIWITEIGGCTYNSRHLIPVRTLDEVRRYQALHQPKTMAGGMAFGAARVLPYNFRDVPVDGLEGEFGSIDRTGLPKTAAMSYRTTALLLGKARFSAFLKNHSFDAGRIAGLVFKDQNQRDVAVLWRNDPYGHNRFDIPFLDTIKPSENISLKSRSSQAELFNMSGGRTVLAAKDGILSIPVSEYPVFVRGQFAPETAEVATTHPVAEIVLPRVRVKIAHNQKSRACDLMTGVTLELTEKTRASVEVRVYNIEKRPVEGDLRLTPISNWREWPWQVSPASVHLSIPANGMGTASFGIPIPAADAKDSLRYLNAIFTEGSGNEFRDTVAFRVVPRKIALSDWITYTKGYRLDALPDQSAIRITWNAERPNSVTFHRRAPVSFADTAADLEQDVMLPCETDGASIRAINLLFRDRNNETFQLKQSVRSKDGQLTRVRFDAAAILKPEVIIHAGGNRQVDFPVSLVGFTFDLKPERNDGSILVRPYEVTSRSRTKVTPATGGGGAADMD
ncbi:SUMF1/EgtB/PvdO family nonheme iron enzyme [Geminisphaera colitermitum]|uniref:SUMF1/EgtB/PvdO family nonheme iron enzyme n=1 Tax=Geminisphaera colitermitum TaxID=1148786 RepID=UPI0005B7798D|nr:SUMF1/EgtB/PvdO family nonheme iron enzyme [Geminisphaera colitermitum]